MSSNPGRKYSHWGTPAGWFLKAIINVLKVEHHNTGYQLEQRFNRLVPCWREVVGNPHATLNSISQRGDKGIRAENESEHPDKHPVGKQYIDAARRVVKRGLPITIKDVLSVVAAGGRLPKIRVRADVESIES